MSNICYLRTNQAESANHIFGLREYISNTHATYQHKCPSKKLCSGHRSYNKVPKHKRDCKLHFVSYYEENGATEFLEEYISHIFNCNRRLQKYNEWFACVDLSPGGYCLIFTPFFLLFYFIFYFLFIFAT
jgi:hypothetical protein